jgi:hypothetical protein
VEDPVDEAEYFGTDEKVALARRGGHVWRLLRDDPRFAYYGRVVALSPPTPDTAEILAALARLQGAAVAYFFPHTDIEGLRLDLERRGFATDRHEHYRGGADAIAASHELLAHHRLPADLTVTRLGPTTPPALVAQTAHLCESCDVMPVPGAAMRGQARPGLCLAAFDSQGAVATASAYMIHHPSSPRATDCFWGMLATRPSRRGEKIALILGAQAIVAIAEEHGARGFMTGVRSGNTSSHALCTRLGVGPTEWVYASCIDRVQLAGPITR